MAAKPKPKPKPKSKPKTTKEPLVKPAQTVVALQARNPDRPLTEMQRQFAINWAQGESIHSASARAGYAQDSMEGYRLRHDPAILKIYAVEKAKFEADNQVTRRKVMDGLMEAIEMAKLINEPAAMISGWREIGKMCGYYEPTKKTIDINVNGSVQIKRLEAMSDADLLKLIKGEVEDVVFAEISEEGGEDDDDQ